jgi:hypothetical protein
MSYIDDEELKIDISDEEEDLEEELDTEDGFNDPIEDDDLLMGEDEDLLSDEFKLPEDTE